MAGPGDYLDPSLWPLFMQSGMAQTPPERITQYSKYRGEPGMPPPEAFLAAMPMPLGAIPRAVSAAPKIASMLGIGGILGASTGQAGEPDNADPEPRRPQEIQDAINAVNTTLAPKRTQLDRLKANFEAKRINQQEYDRRRIPLENEIGRAEGKIGEIDAPFQRQLGAWEQRKNAALEARQKADEALRQRQQEAGLPFRIKYPEATQNIAAGGAGLTGLTALATGLLSKGRLKPTVGAMGMGSAEGALTGNVPELLDLGGFQPIGSPEWEKTKQQMLSTNNLVRTGADAILHGGGAGAVSYGSSFVPKIIDRIKSYFAPGTPPPMLPGSPQGPMGAPMPPSGGPGGLQSPMGLGGSQPSSPPLMVQGKTGLWHYASGSGKTGVVPKHLWPRSDPPPMMGQ